MRTRQDDIFSLIEAANVLAKRTPAQSEAVFDALFGAPMRAAAHQQLMNETREAARAEHRASAIRAARGDNIPTTGIERASLEDVEMPEGVLLPEGASQSPALLDMIGIAPVRLPPVETE